MPKRPRSSYTSGNFYRRPLKRRRTTNPKGSYKRTLVPMATRGYQLNATELKVSDVNIIATTVDSGTSSVTALCVPTPGTDMTNRIGRKILIRSVYIKGMARPLNSIDPDDGLVAPQYLRVALVMDFQPNGSTAAAIDIFTSTNAISNINLNNRDRFKIISDKYYNLGAFFYDATNFMIGCDKSIVNVKIYKKCKYEVIFNAGTAGTTADISSGALLLVLQSSAAGGEGATFEIRSRVRFSDK